MKCIQAQRCHNRVQRVFRLTCVLALMLLFAPITKAGDEYSGKFEPQLVPNTEDLEQVIFRPTRDLSKIKTAKPLDPDAKVTVGRLYHAPSDKSSILAVLVEPENEEPFVYVDLDQNNMLDEKEKLEFKRGEDDNPYILQVIANVPLKEGLFQSYPLFLQYLKNVRWDKLQEDERLLLESHESYARGLVDIQGKKTLVQYDYNPRNRKISPTNGKIGIDSDGDGKIDMSAFSPEAASASEEVVVFRVGNVYVSTKKADAEKNLILLKSHEAGDYKRVELRVGGDVPDFEFTDFNGKKRKLSEFRGKYLLLDFWGMWCGPCRRELPYLKAAYSRYQARGLEILGMNTDEPEIASQLKPQLEKNGLTWPQAKRESITGVIRSFRVHSYPTTMLIGPDGKILSLNQVRNGEPRLRGAELLKSLDRLLPP
ncbi:MAG TPA: TlpA disulfide reductase family protein [Blastocatellia bacterium]|nr:TlpA disulfide reductase family protein [Blastocatellia bacterium]